MTALARVPSLSGDSQVRGPRRAAYGWLARCRARAGLVLLVSLGLVLFELSGVRPAAALTFSPLEDWAEEVVGGRFVLVMLAEDRHRSQYNTKPLIRHQEIRARYAQSGLYPADDPQRPLWTIDDYWFSGVAITQDGRHAARLGLAPWTTDLSSEDLIFYTDGVKTSTYAYHYFVRDVASLPLIGGDERNWFAAFSVGDDGVLAVTTINGERHRFVMDGGRYITDAIPTVLATGQPSGSPIWPWATAGAALLAALFVGLRRR